MINLGRYRTKGFPELRLPFTMTDRIFTILSVIIMLVIWILTTFFYIRNPETQDLGVIVWGGTSSIITLLLYISLRMSSRMFNFPVRVTEYNLARQFFLARRLVGIAMLELNFTMLFRMLDIFSPIWVGEYRLYDILSFVMVGLLFVTFIIYFITAFRWR